MLQVFNQKNILARICFIILLLSIILMSCSSLNNTVEVDVSTFNESYSYTTTFNVFIPGESDSADKVRIDILDEVTGLNINPARYSMIPEGNNIYSVTIPFVFGSLIKYRYVIEDNETSFPEYNSLGQPVRYRLLYVIDDISINDIVYSFNNNHVCENLGRIEGRVLDPLTNSGIPDIQVNAGGIITYTAADGTYILDCVQPGTHNLVAMHINGTYQPFQQAAVVSENSTTPATFPMEARSIVDITFEVKTPNILLDAEIDPDIKVIGNIYDLGNTYADLNGGFSTLASKALSLEKVSSDTYKTTLKLPTGLDLRYKYTIGDGYVNSERNNTGEYFTRQLIVPSQDAVIQDEIPSWDYINKTRFIFIAPGETPASDLISIQFNQNLWSNPIPMKNIRDNEWAFNYYLPFLYSEPISYRYCINGQCEIPRLFDSDSLNNQFSYTPSEGRQEVHDSLDTWSSFKSGGDSPTVVMTNINYRTPFLAGVQISESFSPTWMPFLDSSIINVNNIGANIVVLSPTWEFQSSNPPILKLNPYNSMFYHDVQTFKYLIKNNSLEIALFPKATYNISFQDWWNESELIRNGDWWQIYFNRYENFIIHNAVIANQIKASAIVIENPIPTSVIETDIVENVSLTTHELNTFYSELFSKIRNNFSGAIILAIPSDNLANNQLLNIVTMADQIYIEFSTPFDYDNHDCSNVSIGEILESDIKPIMEKYHKPITISASFPSVSGGACICSSIDNRRCEFSESYSPTDSIDNHPADVLEQANFYNDLFLSVNESEWINGVVSNGYYPPISLLDKSTSVHGKPAADVIWFWFTNLLNVTD